MPSKLISIKLSSASQVLLTGDQCPLSDNIYYQLAKYSFLKARRWPDVKHPPQTPVNVSAIIHIMGFGPPSLSQTLSATSLIHELLHMALSQRSKFILAVYNPHTPLAKTAINLIHQFSKNHPLIVHILEVGQDEVNSESAAILKHLIPNHRHDLVSPPVSYRQPVKSHPKIFIRLLLPILLGFVIVQFFGFLCLLLSQKYLASGNYVLFSKYLSVSSTIIPSFLSNISPFLRSEIRHNTSQLYQVSFQLEKYVDSLLSFSQPPSPELTAKLPDLLDRMQSLINPLPNQNSFLVMIQKIKLLVPYINTILGLSAPQTTMLIFSDSLNPTPTGGKITSLLLVTFDSGKIVSQKYLPLSQLYQDAPGKPDQINLDKEPEFKNVANLLSQLVYKTYQINPGLVISTNSFSPETIKKLPQTDIKSRRQLLAGVYQLLEDRQMFMFHPTSLPELEFLGWSGGIGLPQCRSKLACFQVFYDIRFGPDDPNFPLVSTRVSQFSDITISNQLLTGKITLNLPGKLQPKVILQAFIPKQLQITEILSDGLVQNLRSTVSAYNHQLNKLTIPINTSAVISFSQPLPPQSDKFHFQIDLLAQSGIQTFSTTQVSYPQNWSILLYQKPSVALPGQLRYNTQSQKPLTLDFDFIPK